MSWTASVRFWAVTTTSSRKFGGGGASAALFGDYGAVLENGELGTRPLRFAEATDRYTLKGDETEAWEPRFTFHGFRYVEVNDWPGELKLEDLSALERAVKQGIERGEHA